MLIVCLARLVLHHLLCFYLAEIELKGTSAMCYQDARSHEGSDPLVRGDDHQ